MRQYVLQLGSLLGLTMVGPLIGAWRGRSLAAAGGRHHHDDDHDHHDHDHDDQLGGGAV